MIPKKRDIIKKIGHGKCLKGKKALQKNQKKWKTYKQYQHFFKFWKDNTTLKLITNIFGGTIELYPIV